MAETHLRVAHGTRITDLAVGRSAGRGELLQCGLKFGLRQPASLVGRRWQRQRPAHDRHGRHEGLDEMLHGRRRDDDPEFTRTGGHEVPDGLHQLIAAERLISHKHVATHRRTSREKQRVEKLLEDAQIKLSVVVSDLHGVSGRAMLEAMIGGCRDPKVLAQMARGVMRRKIPYWSRP
jgi:hypothetical protein